MGGITNIDLEKQAIDLGADLVGFADVSSLYLESGGDEVWDDPIRLAPHLQSMIVLAIRLPLGVAGAGDEKAMQNASGIFAARIEAIARRLAYYIEREGAMALVVPGLITDYQYSNTLEFTPAGQGSRLLRAAGVAAGLGTMGLNNMLLTPEFGPRIFLGAVMTDIPLDSSKNKPVELCLGLEECGRCATVCPAQAIPLNNPEGASVAEIRNLDEAACATYSQPFGVERFVEHLKTIFGSESSSDRRQLIRSQMTAELWQNVTVLRHGAMTGCKKCWLVCPVGEDFDKLADSPHRQNDQVGLLKSSPVI